MDKLKKQQSYLEALTHRCLHYAKAFWTINQKARCKILRKGVTCKLSRIRAKKFYRPRQEYPVKGCEGKAVNLRRHLAQCHKDLTLQDRQKAFDAYGKLKQESFHRTQKSKVSSTYITDSAISMIQVSSTLMCICLKCTF